MTLTRGQIALFINKIIKRKELEIEFQKGLHGIKSKDRPGLNLTNAIPIEDIIDGNNNSLKM